MTFDALLGAILFKKYQDVEKAHSEIPIQCDDGLFHASAAQLHEIIDRGGGSITANLRALHDLNPDHIKKKNDDSNELHRKLGLKKRRNCGAVLNNYRTVTVPSISWDVVGDEAKIKALIHDTYFIGKKRTAGFGEVIDWITIDGDSNGVIDTDGRPLRPIPADRFTGDKSLPIIDTAWKPAYWDPKNRAGCYAPELVS